MYLSKVEIDLAKIQLNFQRLEAAFPGKVMAPVIKSDAYGHGVVRTALALGEVGCTHICVFAMDEALQLRLNGIKQRIWVLGGAMPGEEELIPQIGANTAYALWNRGQIARLNAVAKRNNLCIDIHLTVETGMSRLGFFPSELPEVLKEIKAADGLHLCGMFSHLASADNPESSQTAQQVERFRAAAALLPPEAKEVHLCATPGMMAGAAKDFNYLRPGFAIYGYGHDDRMPELFFEPAMNYKSFVISVKSIPDGEHISYSALYTVNGEAHRIAVVPVGYANGYPRCLGNRAEVLVRGHRAPIRGRVCMGMMMIDVTNIPDVTPGDEVVLLGKQGDERITGEELAKLAGTIPYEILCALGKDPNRIYV